MELQKNTLFVGSPPPPYHGQAIMTQIVFETKFSKINSTFHVARFSEDLSSVGGFSFQKVITLIKVFFTMVKYLVSNKNAELYYCAGSANTVPFLRDVILLGTVGKLFKKRYVHYHSGGLPTWLSESAWRNILGKWTYGGATSIACSKLVDVPEGCGEIRELPNGLEVPLLKRERAQRKKLKFLYVGALRETKGVKVLLEAAAILNQRGVEFELSLVGEWVSEEEREHCHSEVGEDIANVTYLGRVTGDAKWEVFSDSDVFVFPSFYESENMPLVVIEALGSSLPVISTNWRSIPSLVKEGKTGYIIEPKSVDELVDRMKACVDDVQTMQEMRSSARMSYEQEYSVAAFRKQLKNILGDDERV